MGSGSVGYVLARPPWTKSHHLSFLICNTGERNSGSSWVPWLEKIVGRSSGQVPGLRHCPTSRSCRLHPSCVLDLVCHWCVTGDTGLQHHGGLTFPSALTGPSTSSGWKGVHFDRSVGRGQSGDRQVAREPVRGTVQESHPVYAQGPEIVRDIRKRPGHSGEAGTGQGRLQPPGRARRAHL